MARKRRTLIKQRTNNEHNFCYSCKNQQQQKCYSTFNRNILILIVILFLQLQNVIAHPSYSSSSQSNPLLLYTTYHDIRLVNVSSHKTNHKILAKDLTEAGALDIYYEKQLICWTEQTLGGIECIKLNDTQSVKRTLTINGLEKPDGIAFDWYTGKIYWTDGETNRVEVASLDGKYKKVLFWTDIDQPRAIALVPSKRLMIWSYWGENPKIERASMDGDPLSRETLVDQNIFWPNGLAVDIEQEKIYWVDGSFKFLDVMDLDGSNRKTILKDLKYPHSVTYVSNKLFWTDWEHGTVHSYDLLQKELQQPFKSEEPPLAIRAWDKRLQPPGNNPCGNNNGKCSHLCLLSSTKQSGYSCACPTGIKLKNEFTCADEPEEMLFIVQRTHINKVSLDSPDYTLFEIPVGKVKHAIAIDYDPVDDMIYWTDEEAHVIRRSNLDGTFITDIVTSEVEHPDGIAVDWIARNLYWTDTGTDRIEVCRLNGSFRKVLINTNLVEPRAIALAPELGWMFWSDWDEKKPKIERASLDGTERVMIVGDELGWPNGIALDTKAQRIYWCDAKLDRIESVKMDGTHRRIVLDDNLPHPFGLSLMGDYLYWTDWQRRTVDRVHKNAGPDNPHKSSKRMTIIDQLPDLMGIRAAKLHDAPGSNKCKENNGNCNHLCLHRHTAGAVCRCQIEYELDSDNATCVKPNGFILYSKQDKIGRISMQFNDATHNEYIPFKDIRDAGYLDIDIQDRRVYWTDLKAKCISRAFINGSHSERVIDSGLIHPEGVAVDWIARNIYWTDTESRRIEVARLDGKDRRTLIWKGIEDPKNLVLEPRRGYMYWTEWEADIIRRAAMDGTEMVKIISSAHHPSGLTFDHETRKLYWARQSQMTGIESANWDGTNRTLLVTSNSDDGFLPHAVTIFQDFLYYSDWNTGRVERIHKINRNENKLNIHKSLEYVSSLQVFHESRQTGTNPCRYNNGGCSHLCLAVPKEQRRKCACPTHFTLASDGSSCIPPRNYLIFSQKNAFGRLLPNTSDAPDTPLPVNAKNVRAVEFDPISHYLYWIDGRSSSIRRAMENGTKPEMFIPAGSQPFDLAVDIIGRFLFWTCSRANTINITSLIDGSSIGNVDKGDSEKPRSIAIHTIKRLLFWTDVGSEQAIYRSRLDGTDRVQLVSKLEGVTALCIDPKLNLVFYAHGKRIDVIDLNGKSKRNLVLKDISQVVSLAAYQGILYWLDDKTGLERILLSGDGRRPELQRLPAITDIVSIWMPEKKVLQNHVCYEGDARCSHICIANPDFKGDETCGCPQGLMLMKDRRNCGALPACGADHFTCAAPYGKGLGTEHNKDCIPMSWRCDGQTDCPDKSDELDCPLCRSDQYRCRSGECIEQNQLCDDKVNCASGEDEQQCCKLPTDYQCPQNGVCIPATQLCDGWEQCADGADESPEVCIAQVRSETVYTSRSVLVTIILCGVVALFFAACVAQICRSKLGSSLNEPKEDPVVVEPLTPNGNKIARMTKFPVVDGIRLKPLNDRTSALSYDRNHITGASSSTTNGSSLNGYPVPPPSPATIGSMRYNGYHPYKHYKSINQAPPPTPCSTDICDESDSNYTSKSNKSYRSIKASSRHSREPYAEPYAPPSTPRYYNPHGSCPPSPGSRSSTDFKYQPPCPSPVH